MKIYPTPSLQAEFLTLLTDACPSAYAVLQGDTKSPDLNGMAYFYQVPQGGVIVEVEVSGLPQQKANETSSFYGMHIHENGDCTPPFDKVGNHYNPANVLHPEHAGDLPPLLSNSGYSYCVFYTDRIQIEEIIGRALVIHSAPDDFTTQPSGNSHEKIGCGVILEM